MTMTTTEREKRAEAALDLLPPPDLSHLEPLPDPPREPDMQQQERIFSFSAELKLFYANRYDVLVAGEGFLRHDPYNQDERFAPDCVVAFGVNPGNIVSRNGYVISEVGKPPDFALEVASRSTGRRDYTVKRKGYARYGVGEYWRFDHTGGRFHDAPLAGDILVGEEYQRLPIHEDEDGLLWGHSHVLGLDLCWDDGILRIRNPATGEFLPTPVEVQAERNAARVERDVAQAQRDAAEAQRDAAEAERDMLEAERDVAGAERDAANVRAAQAEAEAVALRERIRRLERGES